MLRYVRETWNRVEGPHQKAKLKKGDAIGTTEDIGERKGDIQESFVYRSGTVTCEGAEKEVITADCKEDFVITCLLILTL